MVRNKNGSYKTKQTRKTQEAVCSAATGLEFDHERRSAQCSPGASSNKLALTSEGYEAFHSSADRENLYKSNSLAATLTK